jgi:hypothetical protein
MSEAVAQRLLAACAAVAPAEPEPLPVLLVAAGRA